MEQEFKIKEGLLRAVTNYLGRKPFEEVAQLIGALSQLEPIEQKEKEPKK